MGGAVVLATRVTSIPGFVAELLVGFVEVAGFWTMLGASVAIAIGIALILRGRKGIRTHQRAVARAQAMRDRQLQRGPQRTSVSAGVAGTAHRVPPRSFADLP